MKRYAPRRNYRGLSLAERFFLHIGKKQPCGCILWSGRFDNYGYGVIPNPDWPPRDMKAHRASYMVCVGEIPAMLNVLHRCDNPGCVNPCHLFVGTTLDNIADKVAKGRQKGPQGNQGSNNPAAKFSDEIVREIRQVYSIGTASQAQIAIRFRMARQTVGKIVRRERWKHI